MNDDPCIPVQVGGIHAQLTGRQLEVFMLLAQGRTRREIAAILCLTEAGVQKRVEVVMCALGAKTRSEALILLQCAGVLT